MKNVSFWKAILVGVIFAFIGSLTTYILLQNVEAEEQILTAEEYNNMIQQLLIIPEIDTWQIKKNSFENYENWELKVHLNNDIQGGILSYRAETFEELTLSLEKVKLVIEALR